MEEWYSRKLITGTVDVGVYTDRRRTERYPKVSRKLLGREPNLNIKSARRSGI